LRVLSTHPAADLFPLLSGQEFDDLVADIRKHGQREPIRLFDGRILDGRNRYRACVALEIEPKCLDLRPGLNPWDYAWSANAERRHLAPGTRAVVFEFHAKASVAWEEAQHRAQEEANRKRSEAMARNQNASNEKRENSRPSNDVPLFLDDDEPAETAPKPKKSREGYAATKKAKAAGVSEKTMERAHTLVENRPDLADKVQLGEMTLSEAA